MFDKFINGVSYQTMIMGFIGFLVLLIGCMMYFMKDPLFPSKQVLSPRKKLPLRIVMIFFHQKHSQGQNQDTSLN